MLEQQLKARITTNKQLAIFLVNRYRSLPKSMLFTMLAYVLSVQQLVLNYSNYEC